MTAKSFALHGMLQYYGRTASEECRVDISDTSNERLLCTLHPYPPRKHFNLIKHVTFSEVCSVTGGIS